VSGLAVSFFSDGRPPDEAWLARATEHLQHGGPDGTSLHKEAGVALLSTRLILDESCALERQPLEVEPGVWLVADVRVDDRDGLCASLGVAARTRGRYRSDVELLAEAWRRFGDETPARVLGDYAFVVVDTKRKRLFASRDVLGVRPLYWARVPGGVVLANHLGTVLAHPAVDDELSDEAVGEWLVFGNHADATRTFYRHVHRLAPRYGLVVDERSAHTKQLWKVPAPETARYDRPGDVPELFRETLKLAVADRLRAPRASVAMSGGLDSTSVAALAVDVARERGGVELRAITVGMERNSRDEEPHYSRLAAAHLGVAHEVVPLDDLRWFAGWDEPPRAGPQPGPIPWDAGDDVSSRFAAGGRTALSGAFGDPLLVGSERGVADAVRAQGPSAVVDALRSFALHGKRPALGLGAWAGAGPWGVRALPVTRPAWLSRALRGGLDVQGLAQARAAAVTGPPPVGHPRQILRSECAGPAWPTYFEGGASAANEGTVDAVYPFADLRLVRLALAWPLLPWTLDKEVLRAAMAGRLPDAVRLRPKAPLRVRPRTALSEPQAALLRDLLQRAEGAERFVDRARLRERMRAGAKLTEPGSRRFMRALSLVRWLAGRASARAER
jgi:asparagine synthase (glutamine-hydrolysing)